jgi:uncharacterized protein YwqG
MKATVIVLTVLLVATLIFIVSRKGGAKHPTPHDGNLEVRDIRSLVGPLSKPAILIKTTGEDAASYFGGGPPLFPGFAWPERDGRAMAFLACIDLSRLPSRPDWLPATGRLLFFYDMEEQPWGFDPKDRGGWAVLHVTEPIAQDAPAAAAPANLKPENILNKRGMRFKDTSLPPSWEEEVLAGYKFTEAEDEALIELRSALYGEGAKHQIGGYPNTIQNPEMQLECQLASNGLYCGNSSGYEDPRYAELEPGAKDWRLLLQMDSDDDLDVMWGDSGTVYFWVREDEAKRGDFSNAWLVLQCY